MALTRIDYIDEGKKRNIFVKKVPFYSIGLIFKKRSSPLMFELKDEKCLGFTSVFCKKFYMIVLDKNKKVVDKIYFDKWKIKVNCCGKYFIEIMEINDGTSSEYRNI
jgi:hypothetical protein